MHTINGLMTATPHAFRRAIPRIGAALARATASVVAAIVLWFRDLLRPAGARMNTATTPTGSARPRRLAPPVATPRRPVGAKRQETTVPPIVALHDRGRASPARPKHRSPQAATGGTARELFAAMLPCVLAVATVFVALTPRAAAQCVSCLQQQYVATSGLPPASCWYVTANTGGSSADLIGSFLRMNSPAGEFIYQLATRPPYLWSEGQTMEARIRVTSGGSGFFTGFRAAAFFSGADDARRICSVYIATDRLSLSTDQSVVPGPGTAILNFDAASAFHTYTLATDGGGASLRIDGVERLRVPYSTVHPSARNSVEFGNDARFNWVSVSEWEFIQFSSIVEPDSARTCSSGTAAFSVTPSGIGPFTYHWQSRNAASDWVNISDGPLVGSGGTVLAAVSGSAGSTVSIQVVRDFGHTPEFHDWRCIVTNACGSVTSNPATLTICVADTDDGSGSGTCDGGVTIDDLLYYLRIFEDGAIAADVDDGSGTGTPDGGVTIDDLLYYLQRFEAGC